VPVVLDVWRFVAVVRKGRSQMWIFGVRLRIIPANTLFTLEDGVTVVEKFAIR
jgi:hypothetical protein